MAAAAPVGPGARVHGMAALAVAGPDAMATTTVTCGHADLSGLHSRVYVSAQGTDSDTCGSSLSAACADIGQAVARRSGLTAWVYSRCTENTS